MCENFNLEPSKEFKAVFSLYVTPDKLSGLVDDVGIVKQEDLNISLAQKVDKVDGKSLVEDAEIQRLSTLENYNDSQIKQDISNIKSNLNTKVDKVDGKQLSTNDFTDTLKSKLDSIDAKSKVYSVNGQTGDVKINEYTLPTASTTTLGGVKVDGTTITINNGVISSSGGSGETGTTNYNDLLNKPQINGVELSGNKTLDNLGIQAKGDYALKSNIPTKTSQLTNDSGFLTAHQDISNLATKSELNNKVDKVSGKQLSTNDFTTALKNKLDSVDVNAKVYSVNGQTGAVTIDVPDTSGFATKDELNSLVQPPTSNYSNPAVYAGATFNASNSLESISVDEGQALSFNTTITVTETGYYDVCSILRATHKSSYYGKRINVSLQVSGTTCLQDSITLSSETFTVADLSGPVYATAGQQIGITVYNTAGSGVAVVLYKLSAVRVYSPFDLDVLTPKVVEDSTSTTATIAKAEANTTYKYGTLTSLTVTEVENSPLPITVIFTTATSSPTINLPATLESINLADGFEAEKKYVLAIENNIAVIGSIE